MNQPRALLWIGLALLVYLNVNAWMKDYLPPAGAPPPATATGAAGTEAAKSAANELADEMPAVIGEAAPATAPLAQVPELGESAAAGPGKVRIVTDVLDIDLSLAGGEWIRADVTRYPRHKDDPTTPVRLFNTDSVETQFLFQSGLTSGEAGRNEPNHKAPLTAAAGEFRLAPGSDTLEVPLTWSDGAGLSVTKTFVFRRGSYQVGVNYRVVNAGSEPVKLASYAQLLRHSQGNERSMWDPETYSFRGPAYYDGEKYQKLDIEDDEDQALSRSITGGWVAALQHHFVAAIVPAAGQAYQYGLRVKNQDFMLRVVGPAQVVPPGGSVGFSETIFVGPKLQYQLEAAGPELRRTADYGLLTILAQPLFWLLSKIYEYVGNWGFTIIIVTFLIIQLIRGAGVTSVRNRLR